MSVGRPLKPHQLLTRLHTLCFMHARARARIQDPPLSRWEVPLTLLISWIPHLWKAAAPLSCERVLGSSARTTVATSKENLGASTRRVGTVDNLWHVVETLSPHEITRIHVRPPSSIKYQQVNNGSPDRNPARATAPFPVLSLGRCNKKKGKSYRFTRQQVLRDSGPRNAGHEVRARKTGMVAVHASFAPHLVTVGWLWASGRMWQPSWCSTRT